MDLGLHIIIYTCQIQTLADALIGILEVVFAHQSDVDLTSGVALFVEEVVPGFHGWCLTHRDADLSHNGSVEALLLHAYGHLVDRGHILALHYAFEVDITK